MADRGDSERASTRPIPDGATWLERLVGAARGGAPALRTLLSSEVELRVAFGSTWEAAHGATITSEWLAGRLTWFGQQGVDIRSYSSKGNRVVARVSFSEGSSVSIAWTLEAVLNADGLATEITLRTLGSA